MATPTVRADDGARFGIVRPAGRAARHVATRSAMVRLVDLVATGAADGGC